MRVHRVLFLATAILLLPCWANHNLAYGEEVETTEASESSRWSMGIRGGVSGFLKTQSFAFPHLVKPTARLELTYAMTSRFLLGIEGAGLVSDDEGYRLYGGYLVGRAAMMRGEIFSLWFGWGVGAGTDAPILSKDLTAAGDLILWHQLGLHTRWDLVADTFGMGLDLLVEHLSVGSLTATVYVNF